MSTSYAISRNDLIKSSLRIAGALAAGETPSADEQADAIHTLHQVLRTLDAQGIHLWKRTEVSFSPTTSKVSYKVGPSGDVNTTQPTRVQYAFRRSTSNIDTELTRISMEEYWRLPNKTSSGTPTQYAVDPQLSNTTVYIWPAVSSNNLVNVYLQCDMRLDDVSNSSDALNIPPEWYQALKWALAAELAPEYSQDLNFISFLQNKAQVEIEKVKSWDMEDASIQFKPVGR